MSEIKVGLQLYSVRDDMGRDFEGTLKHVKEIGYDYVEFAGYYGKTAEEVKALLDKYGLTCISVHQAPSLFATEGKPSVDFLNTIGARYAAVPWYEASKLAGTSEWENTKELFNSVGALLKEGGIQMMYHNHDFEFQKFEGKYLFDWIYETFPFINPEIDVCWASYAGVNPAALLRKYSGKVKVVHFKDYFCSKDASGPVYALIDEKGGEAKSSGEKQNDFRFRPVGQGVQNFDEIIGACKECGTEYVIVEQDQTYETPALEACRQSREFLKSKGL